MNSIALISLMVSIAPVLLAQQPARLQFEVATVKPMVRNADGSYPVPHISGGRGSSDPGRISWVNYDLRYLVLMAFDVRPYQLAAPDWFSTSQFVIEATLPKGATREQVNQMLQNLLVDRFHMVVRRETRDVSLYDLVLVKTGPKLKESRPPGADETEPLPLAGGFNVYGLLQEKDGFLRVPLHLPPMYPGTALPLPATQGSVGGNQPIGALASFLSARLARPVVDKTGLTGNWDYNLEFASGPAAAQSEPEPDLITAVEKQLGLKLEPRKGPLLMLIIDRAEKTPAGN